MLMSRRPCTAGLGYRRLDRRRQSRTVSCQELLLETVADLSHLEAFSDI